MKPVGHFLDPAKFTVIPKVAIIDEFEMTGDDGSFVATIDEPWLDACVSHMNEREQATGDLSPGVIGHTLDGVAETAQPPVTAFFRNWVKDDFFETGRKAAFADVWVYNEHVEQVRKFPRRSAEVWVNRHEIDPVSFLGATTPCRDLGLMKLSRSGGDLIIQRECPQMPDEKKTEDTNRESSGMKELKDLLQQVLAAVTKQPDVVEKPADKPPETGAEGGDISDEELEQMMKEMGGGGEESPPSRKEEPKPEKQSAETETVKLQREVNELRGEVVRGQVKDQLSKLQRAGFVAADPEDTALVADLVAMPPEIRTRQLERLKLSRKEIRQSFNVDSAIGASTDGEVKRMTPADKQEIIKLARSKNVSFEAAAAERGFVIHKG